ncbi:MULTISPECIES: Acg family FMN-binding oxidoreductase [unclassified Streptomyces]|uniref:Acg family FMN-binding oxidoreductase n=1 Tax=unclassified Streptomyces TaxID=2593676 RepID=UPI00380AB2E9
MATSVLDAVVLEKLISAAVAAPSFHNSQPWRFRLEPETATLFVRAAGERGLREADPMGRAVHLSVGAAVFNLRVASAHLGWEPVVRLLPVPAQPDLLASVRLAGPPRAAAEHRGDLYQALWRRHSSRSPFSAHRPPGPVLAELTDSARTEGAALHLPDADETERLLELTAEAERRDASDAARRTESRGWIRDGARDGLPTAVLGPLDSSGRLPVRDFSGLRPENHVPAAAFEQRPLIAVLSTADDRPADWLRAGQALERVLLVATTHRLRASLLHQALEWPDLRWELRSTGSGPVHVQMLIRLGYGPEGAASPRRPAAEVLEGLR